MERIIVGSRDSQLAIMQTEIVINQLLIHQPDLVFERKTYKNLAGQMHMQSMGIAAEKEEMGKGLDAALLDGDVDLTVSSLKDVPLDDTKDMSIAAFIRREDARDALLVRKENRSTIEPEKMIVGTASLRRKVQLECLYKGIQIKQLHGDIITRIQKLENGEYDGVILAAAGVHRAGLSEYIGRYFTEEEIVPAAGQGILVVQTKKEEYRPLLQRITNEEAKTVATAERAYMRELHSNCKLPAGVYACIKNKKLYLTGMYYGEKTKKCYKESVIGYQNEAEKLGIFFANYMRRRYGP